MDDLYFEYMQFFLYICVYLTNIHKNFYFSFFFHFFFKDLGGIDFVNPHETTVVHYGEHRDLKGLLHVPTTTVIPMKVS